MVGKEDSSTVSNDLPRGIVIETGMVARIMATAAIDRAAGFYRRRCALVRVGPEVARLALDVCRFGGGRPKRDGMTADAIVSAVFRSK